MVNITYPPKNIVGTKGRAPFIFCSLFRNALQFIGAGKPMVIISFNGLHGVITSLPCLISPAKNILPLTLVS